MGTSFLLLRGGIEKKAAAELSVSMKNEKYISCSIINLSHTEMPCSFLCHLRSRLHVEIHCKSSHAWLVPINIHIISHVGHVAFDKIKVPLDPATILGTIARINLSISKTSERDNRDRFHCWNG